MKNNGHTAKMSLGGTNEKNNWSPKIRGTALNNHIYQFNELHFHWDQNDTSGSEHSIHGSRQALEMHLVHWNLKYTSMEEAAKHEDGLAVVAILFAANVEENPLLFPIIDHLDDIIPYDSVVKIEEPFTLRSLLPSSYRTFYRYEGSLTTPPCSQVVTWIVVTQVQKIGYAQLNEFTRLDNRENTLVGNTNRRLQSLNGRKVEVSSDAHCFRNDRKRKTYHEGSQSVVGTTLPPNNERLENTTVVPIPVDPSVSKSFWQLIASYFQVPLAFTNVLTQKGETPGYFVSNESIGSSLS
jgi:carbonic anhydrase